MRISYLEITESWLHLAEEIEWAASKADLTKGITP
jgi:hypothetical protein